MNLCVRLSILSAAAVPLLLQVALVDVHGFSVAPQPRLFGTLRTTNDNNNMNKLILRASTEPLEDVNDSVEASGDDETMSASSDMMEPNEAQEEEEEKEEQNGEEVVVPESSEDDNAVEEQAEEDEEEEQPEEEEVVAMADETTTTEEDEEEEVVVMMDETEEEEEVVVMMDETEEEEEDDDDDDDEGVAMMDEATTSEAEESDGSLVALLSLASRTGRGEFATNSEKQQAAQHVGALEQGSPIAQPTDSTTIRGTWELVYSSTQLFRSSPFFMAGRAVCQTKEQADQYDWFCDMHRKALAISTIGSVRQIIDNDDRMTSEFEVRVGSVPFLSDFTPLAYSGGWPVTIDGAIVSSADLTPTTDGTGWEIYMDTVEIKGSNIPLLRQLLDGGLKLQSRWLASVLEDNLSGMYTTPRPLFTTTYLSEDLRISRDQDDNIFVYTKVSDSMEPTDYAGTSADLGLLGLLEGFNDKISKIYI